MRRQILQLIIISALFCNETFAQITFQKTYSTPNSQSEFYVQSTSDGGFVVTGGSTNLSAGALDFYLLRTDGGGNALWSKTYGGFSSESAFAVQQANDGGFVMCGNTSSFGNGDADFLVVKTDSNGTVVWSKTFGGGGSDEAWSMCKTADNGFVIVGNADSFNGDAMIKIDSNGNMVWTKIFLSVNFASICLTPDHGFAIGGRLNGSLFLLKVDSVGNQLWDKTYSTNGSSGGCNLALTSDGGYVLASATTSGTDKNAFVVRTDNTGTLLWAKSYGGSGYEDCSSVIQTTDGGFALLCDTYSFTGSPQIAVIKTDSAGTPIWTKTYDGFFDGSILQTNDGGLIFSSSESVRLIKTNSVGVIGCNEMEVNFTVTSATPTTGFIHINETLDSLPSTIPSLAIGGGLVVNDICVFNGLNEIRQPSNNITVFPSPFSTVTTISFELQKPGDISLKVFDMNGRLIDDLADHVFHEGKNELVWHTENVEQGIYVLQMVEGTNVQTLKMVVQ